jgi:signal transduction histidine kinase
MDECIDKPQLVEIKTALHMKKGVPLFLSFHFIPSHDENGKVVNYFGICRDVSEMRITEHQLSEEKVKMEGVEALKNSFLHNMSFEIRTPLTTVVGFSELFQMEHTDEEELVFVKEIKENSRILLGLVNNILLLSRLDAKMIEIRTKPVDLSKTFDALCREAWTGHQKKGVSFYAENPFNQLKVNIDILNLGIVISQIVANAAQHTEQGFVRARYDYSGTALTIAVEDTGSGITEKNLEHIFERFVTDTGTGVGLGLSICKELVELMKGEINIKSRPGKGTTVWISIPCQVIEYERK